ncbi:hypothetical protein CMV_006751 [Castanea mollissima]|uniref:Bifunctional inhibitor/plant lipid transfer protein/seed storage helical domain-containing protein n=1 Tax=Castanea mollissima TaxID=60419 RepID=A0A8J4W0S7_9ROSI|nr:hypothetical protein CMV_006751 [Castanea mollissima]
MHKLGPHPAPVPSVNCSALISNMAECLSYVTIGSTVTKPEGTCCVGFKTVLKVDAECLCEAFKSSASLGVVLDITKATALLATCKVFAPSTATCGLSLNPAGAPGLSFMQTPKFKILIGASPGIVAIIVSVMIICHFRRELLSSIVVMTKKNTTENQYVKEFIKNQGSLQPKRYSYSEIK